MKASQSSRTFSLLSVLVLGLGLTDCNCNKPKIIKAPGPGGKCASGAAACSSDLNCNDHESCITTNNESCCAAAPRTCNASADCCPGQICKRDHHCFDQRVECPNGDSDCGDPGSDRVCLTYKDSQNHNIAVCGYAACDTSNPCREGLNCFQGFCVASPPCNGHCDDGSICVPQNNSCWAYGTRCSVSCSAGYLAMEKNPQNVWDSCNNRDVECQCVELPPLTSTDLGRYSSSTALGNQLAVSMYDGQYGDLVVRLYDATGTLQKTEYVDGVPSDGTVVAGPSGPRAGIADPGDDVGLYTSIAASQDGQSLFVSYYDATHGDLKFATRDAQGNWTNHTVDSVGDVGLYTSLALDNTGKPAIAYFQKSSASGGTSCAAADPSKPDLTTGVKIARAKTASPASKSDWTVTFVECASRPPPPCYGCGSGQICVGAAGTCAATAQGCTGCSSTQVCANINGAGPACQDAYSSKPLASLPVGVGLFPSLAFKDATAVVAYYDRINHSLKAATGTSTTFTPVEMDGDGKGTQSLDTGLFPSVAIEPTGSKRIAIAYHDAQSRALRFYMAATLAEVASSPAADGIIDDGLAPPTGDGPSFVGANVNLHFTSDGKLLASYQNSTAGDLDVAEHGTGGWSNKKKVSQGSVGYWSHITQVPGQTNLLVTHAKLHTKLVQNHPTKDHSLQVDKVTP